MTGRTKVIAGPFWTRRKARRVERDLQAQVRSGDVDYVVGDIEVPCWARGVRVEKLGIASWTVVATNWKGR